MRGQNTLESCGEGMECEREKNEVGFAESGLVIFSPEEL